MAKLKEDIAGFVGNYTRKMGYPPTVEELIMVFGTFKIMVAMLYVLNLYRIGMMNYPHQLSVGKGFCYAASRHEPAGCSMQPAEQGMSTMPLSH